MLDHWARLRTFGRDDFSFRRPPDTVVSIEYAFGFFGACQRLHEQGELNPRRVIGIFTFGFASSDMAIEDTWSHVAFILQFSHAIAGRSKRHAGTKPYP